MPTSGGLFVFMRMRDLLAQMRAHDPAARALLDDDITHLEGIALSMETGAPPLAIADALREYYGDLARAQRTPRAFLYLHLGILIGLIERPDDGPDA